MLKKLVALGVLTIFMAINPGLVGAEAAYPKKSLRLVVPYPPGGATDIMGRLLGEHLSVALGQPVLVENKPGASGSIGADMVAKAAGDGYTIGLVINTHIINGQLLQRISYDTQRDFVGVAAFARVPFLLVVNPEIEARSLSEFIAEAKRKPGQINMGMVGASGIGRIVAEQFSEQAGVRFNHIPYKGTAQLMTDLQGGRTDVAIDTANTYIEQIKAKRVRGLAVASEKRMAALSDIPTFAEQGISGYENHMWFGIVAPSATPLEIIDRLSAEITAIAQKKDFIDTLAAREVLAYPLDRKDFEELLRADTKKYAVIIKNAEIKAE